MLEDDDLAPPSVAILFSVSLLSARFRSQIQNIVNIIVCYPNSTRAAVLHSALIS